MRYQIISKCIFVTVFFLFQGTFSFARPGLKEIQEPNPSQLDQSRELYQSVDITLKNENIAWILPFATTLATVAGGTIFALNTEKFQGAGVGLAAAGLILGPSLGHLYAGETWRGVSSSLGRLASVGAILLGGGLSFACAFGNTEGSSCDPFAGGVLIFGGLGTLVVLTIWDIVDAPSAAKRHNEKIQQLSISPMMLAPPPGVDNSSMAYGLSLSGRF